MWSKNYVKSFGQIHKNSQELTSFTLQIELGHGQIFYFRVGSWPRSYIVLFGPHVSRLHSASETKHLFNDLRGLWHDHKWLDIVRIGQAFEDGRRNQNYPRRITKKPGELNLQSKMNKM